MIQKADGINIAIAAEMLKKGEVVAFPTETVYGLGADMNNEAAIRKVFEVKNRPLIDPLIVHIADRETLDTIAIIEDPRIDALIEAFWPGPLTMILPKRDCVGDLVTSGLDTVAVRMPNHPVAKELISLSTGTIVAPSANPFGYLSPTKAIHVEEPLGDKIGMVLDGGNCEVGVESTVLDMSGAIPTILRPGNITEADIRAVVGEATSMNRKSKTITAPGQFPMHYSPRTPLIILKQGENGEHIENCGFLGFSENRQGYKVSSILSSSGDLKEAAHNLFTVLHDLDKEDITTIYVEQLPEDLIGKAIMDRLYKASKK